MKLTSFYLPVLTFHQEMMGHALPNRLRAIATAKLSALKPARRLILTRWLLITLLVIVAFPLLAVAQTRPPVLISEPTSTRAIAFESPTFFREPFSLASPYAWSTDRRTRVMLFALNLSLQSGEDLSVVTADAEDAGHRRYNLQVEHVGPIESQPWLSAVILRLSDELTNTGDVLVRVYYRGVGSNRVRIGVGHIGGGPPDDAGSGPTIVPPYVINGRVLNGTSSLGGVPVTLNGTQTQTTTTTDDNGFYSFTVETIDDYVLTVSKPYYDFSPPSRTFINLSNHQPDVNFNATRQAFNVSGQVLDDHGQALSGIEVALLNEVNGVMSTALTDESGNFSFTNLSAGYNYMVVATNNNFFTFTRQTIVALDSHQTLSFSGVRSVYTIQGKAMNAACEGLNGVTVNLSGSQTATTTTDVNGNYSFTNLPAGGNYDVSLSKVFYVFSPQHQSFSNLSSNQQADFAGVDDNRIISGRVIDGNGDGLGGIEINLSGSQTRTVRTDSDGHFSLPAGATGDYIITPSIEQDSYSFTPSNLVLQNLTGNQTVNFFAVLAPLPNPSYVLEFDGAPKSVDYGYFWTPYVDLGHFYWEFWAMPGVNAGGTYLLSDGYGGHHALLFGFSHYNEAEPGRYQLYGNIFDGYPSGANLIPFYSDEGPAPGEWGHFAVGWDGQSIVIYFNGVPVGKKAYAGTRATPSPGHGGTRLLIGGSDHSNFIGRIAQVRGYEGRNPLAEANGPTGGTIEAAFAPQTIFGSGGNLLSYFFRPAPKIADLSGGYNGIAGNGNKHPGTVRGTTFGILSDCGPCPPPRFVIDPTAPDFAQNIAPPPVLVPTPPPVPGQARIFDSFSRANSTYLFYNQGGL
ncbi:MAG: carboxypeptidase regulatory-like domain-containing protein, partial [Pyrinomonadaceae bacterium]|nr:carboxypeptidase regulatory-like domain-containing protein [Pyrinomonadaceae bacterium]